MPRLDRKLEQFLLGTAIEISVKLRVPTASSCIITIQDPTQNNKVTNATMIKQADYMYTYIFQSDSLWDYGVYVMTIKTTYADKTGVAQYAIEMLDQNAYAFSRNN